MSRRAVQRSGWRRIGRSAAGAAIALLGCAAAIAQKSAAEPEGKTPDDELSERLIRRAVTDRDEDLMAGIIRMMNEAARRLRVEFDAAAQTQALHDRIVDRLDEAIRLAAAQRRYAARDQESASGDKRRRPSGGKGDAQARPPPRADERSSAQTGTGETGQGALDPAARDGALWESRRSWGRLPERERDEIIQGVDEEFLERYRAWIERYYRALQILDE